VLVPAVEPVDLTVLLDELEAANTGAVIPDEGAEPVSPRNLDGPLAILQIQKGQGVLKLPISMRRPEDHAGNELFRGNEPMIPRG
jgi:hypothetical protein